MTALRRFARLSSAERALLVQAGLLLIVIRLMLWLVPWRRAIIFIASMRVAPSTRFSVDRLEWAVRTAAQVVPRETCLTRALALRHFLSRGGHPSIVQIGVATEPGGRFVAHAWVEHDDEILLSTTEDVARYTRFLTLDDALLEYLTAIPSETSR
jgi:hypothetical protein